MVSFWKPCRIHTSTNPHTYSGMPGPLWITLNAAVEEALAILASAFTRRNWVASRLLRHPPPIVQP